MVAFAIAIDAAGAAFFTNEPFDADGLSHGWNLDLSRGQTGVTFREMVQRSPTISFYTRKPSGDRIFIICRDRLAALNPDAPQAWVAAECFKAISERSSFSQFLDQAVPALGFSIVGALTGGAAAALLAGGLEAVDQGGTPLAPAAAGPVPPEPFARNVAAFDIFTLAHVAGGILAALTGVGPLLFFAGAAATEAVELLLEDRQVLDAESTINRVGDLVAAAGPYFVLRAIL